MNYLSFLLVYSVQAKEGKTRTKKRSQAEKERKGRYNDDYSKVEVVENHKTTFKRHQIMMMHTKRRRRGHHKP